MKFVKIKTVKGETVVLNMNLVISIRVTHPTPDSVWTEIDVARMASKFYISGDITKEFEKVINSSKDGIFDLRGE